MDRFAPVEEMARTTFGAAPRWRFLVPGRLEVFGKHTDYAGGHALVAAVPRGFAVAALARSDGRVVVADARSGELFECPTDAPAVHVTGWRRYVATVVRRLSSNFPGADLSTSIVFSSDVPPASGISSSSALVISIAESVIARAGLEQTERWRAAIRGLEERAAYFGCLENGAAFGQLAGNDGVGTHGGSEDHAAILASRAGHLLLCAFSPLRFVRPVRMPEGWTFVVASSGVRASKTGGAQRDYNRLAASAAAIVAAWRSRHPGDPRSLAELASSAPLDTLPLERALAERLEHFVRENARVGDAAEALARGDLERLGVLADESQRDAARLLRNQVPETIDLVSMGKDLGAVAASAFGAGWGGSVWALVSEAAADEFAGRWLRAYADRHPHAAAEAFVSPPSDGILRYQ
ncbi:MAG TPA: galactokinase family protein [Vicinamibacterales bacterium]|nr:galactokinase family protein [Vicinamibacterales bacterium]